MRLTVVFNLEMNLRTLVLIEELIVFPTDSWSAKILKTKDIWSQIDLESTTLTLDSNSFHTTTWMLNMVNSSTKKIILSTMNTKKEFLTVHFKWETTKWISNSLKLQMDFSSQRTTTNLDLRGKRSKILNLHLMWSWLVTKCHSQVPHRWRPLTRKRKMLKCTKPRPTSSQSWSKTTLTSLM